MRRTPDPDEFDWKQRGIVREFEEFLGTNPAETAMVLGVSYSTYMKWRIGSRTMNASAKRCMSYVRFIVRAGLELPLVAAEIEDPSPPK